MGFVGLPVDFFKFSKLFYLITLFLEVGYLLERVPLESSKVAKIFSETDGLIILISIITYEILG